MRRTYGWVAVFFAIGLGVYFYRISTTTIGLSELGVVSQNGEVTRVLGPGPHVTNPLTESVDIYPANLVGQVRVTGSIRIGACSADSVFRYRIGDVVAFHEAGGSFDVIVAIEDELTADPFQVATAEDVLDGYPPLEERVRSAAPAWLAIDEVFVELGDCAPPEPQIERIEQPLPPIQTVGELGAERSGPISAALILADGAQVQVENVRATWRVDDASLIEACFGRVDRLDTVLQDVVNPRLRILANQFTLTELPSVSDGLLEAMRERLSASSEADCGYTLGAVDFSEASVVQIVERVVEPD